MGGVHAECIGKGGKFYFCGDENILTLIVAMLAHHMNTKHCWTVYFKGTNSVLCKLCITEAFFLNSNL